MLIANLNNQEVSVVQTSNVKIIKRGFWTNPLTCFCFDRSVCCIGLLLLFWFSVNASMAVLIVESLKY